MPHPASRPNQKRHYSTRWPERTHEPPGEKAKKRLGFHNFIDSHAILDGYYNPVESKSFLATGEPNEMKYEYLIPEQIIVCQILDPRADSRRSQWIA